MILLMFFQDVNHINFFDIGYPEIPNDDESIDNNLNRDQKSQSDSSSSSVSGSNVNTADFPVDNPGNDADSSDNFVATQNKEVATLEENIFSEGNLDQNPNSSHCVQNVRRSSRQSVFPKNYNDFVVESKVKYGLEKYVDLGKLKYFLGIEVVDAEKGICLNQRKYVLDLLSEYGMLVCKPAKTPLVSKLVISNEACEKDRLLDNITDYQKLMGKLIYLTNTRPDISYDEHCLSQFMHFHLKSHLKIAFKILRYFKSCPGLGIHIVKTSGMFLNAYSDADWAK
ncbi:ribonuclease H-like domain-containing protein [Tanacetum coccineum]|uniref:Ribonuclease H-like domain-containing protein n=1 Tax=Tanacetum coccineum TaxID=301880 RepID=A0ABQ4WLC1_9ASTR